MLPIAALDRRRAHPRRCGATAARSDRCSWRRRVEPGGRRIAEPLIERDPTASRSRAMALTHAYRPRAAGGRRRSATRPALAAYAELGEQIAPHLDARSWVGCTIALARPVSLSRLEAAGSSSWRGPRARSAASVWRRSCRAGSTSPAVGSVRPARPVWPRTPSPGPGAGCASGPTSHCPGVRHLRRRTGAQGAGSASTGDACSLRPCSAALAPARRGRPGAPATPSRPGDPLIAGSGERLRNWRRPASRLFARPACLGAAGGGARRLA